jgi:hypothetical protein
VKGYKFLYSKCNFKSIQSVCNNTVFTRTPFFFAILMKVCTWFLQRRIPFMNRSCGCNVSQDAWGNGRSLWTLTKQVPWFVNLPFSLSHILIHSLHSKLAHEAKLQTCILKAHVSNLGRDTNYLEGFYGFSQSFQAYFGALPKITWRAVSFKTYATDYSLSSYHSTPYSPNYWDLL